MPQRFTYEDEVEFEEVYEEDDPWEYDQEDNYSSEDLYDQEYEESWPQPIVYRPPIKTILKHSAPPIPQPEPLSEDILADYEAYKKKSSELNTIHSANCAALKKLTTELATLEESSQGVNKWSQRQAKDAQKKRLEDDIAAAEAKKEESKAAVEKHKAYGSNLRDIINTYENAKKLWDEMEADKKEIARLTKEAQVAVEKHMAEWRKNNQ